MADSTERDVLVEEYGTRAVPLRQTSNLPKISLQQAARDGREDVVRSWLSIFGNKLKKLNEKDKFGFTAMHYAARFNRFKIMQLLFANDADGEVCTDEGVTPLHYAARYTPITQDDTNDDDTAPVTLRSNSRQILLLLVTLIKVNVNARDNYGQTPLHYACARGNRIAVQILLADSKIDVNIQDKQDDTPLHEACLNGDVMIVEMLLDKGADCLLSNDERVIPLHLACQEGYTDIVVLLLRKRFDQRAQLVGAIDNEYNQPLHLACTSGKAEMVKILFLNEADPNAVRLFDISPLHIAARDGHTEIAEVLLQNPSLDINVRDEHLSTPLHYAAKHNEVAMIKFLLAKNADIESQDVDSFTPLLTAVSHGCKEAMEVLLANEASVDAIDRDGKSMVFKAAEGNRHEVLKSLIFGTHAEVGNKLVAATNATYNTPLHIASKKGHLQSVKVLLRAEKVKADARNEEGRTPMHLAAMKGHVRIISELVRHGYEAKLDLVIDEDDDSNTPLHLACISGHWEAAKILLVNEADPNARNARNWTPLDCAANGGWNKTALLLIENGADIDPRDKANVTPLQLAAQEGHLEVVKVLLENGASASITNTSEMNALDIAVENRKKDVALTIIKSNQMLPALRNVTHMQGGVVTTPLRRIMKKMPEVAKEVFNRCAVPNDVSKDDMNYQITFNYEFLEDFRDQYRRGGLTRAFTRKYNVSDAKSSVSAEELEEKEEVQNNRGFQTGWGPMGYSRSNHCLNILANSKSAHLLEHPLVTSLLDYKWRKFGQFIYMGNVAIHTIFLLFLTALALTLLSPISQTCNAVFSGNEAANNSDLCTEFNETTVSRRTFIVLASTIVIIFAIIKLIFEAFQLLKETYRYFLDYVNYIEVVLFVGSIMFAFVYFNECFCPYNWQWQLGALSVFLGWIDLVIIIRKFPVTGIYVVMFMNIFIIFIKLAFLALLLILSFAFSFYMLFHQPINLLANITTPFRDPGRSIIKTMTMTTGEFEFDTIFRQGGEANTPDLDFPVVSYILWITFLILMPILLTNLLVGLAVDDIKGVQSDASVQRHSLRVELTLAVEEFLPNFLRRKFMIGSRIIKPNRPLTRLEFIRYEIFHFYRFDALENITNALYPPPEPIDEVIGQNWALGKQLDDMRKRVDMLVEQNEELLALVGRDRDDMEAMKK